MIDNDRFKPLLAIGAQYIRETYPKASIEVVSNLENILDLFIDGKVSYEKASEEFMKGINSLRPLEKIDSVLKADDKPIVPETETQQQSNLIQVYGFNNSSRKKTHPWSEYEDIRLLSGIHKYGLDNWISVSTFVGNGRTRAQCSQRWFRGLDPRISKVLWTREEDIKLAELVERYGDRSWTKIAAELGNRSDAQCRYHFRQLQKEKEDESNSSNHASGTQQISLISSAPNVPIRNENLVITPIQSDRTLFMNVGKIPSISTLIDQTNLMPDHIRNIFTKKNNVLPGKI